MSEQSERLLEAMSQIPDSIVEEAAPGRFTVKKKRKWVRRAALAACLVLAVGVAGVLPFLGGAGGSAGGGGVETPSVFMSYAGPVFPLDLLAGGEGLTADRHTTLDFAPWVPVWVSNGQQLEEARAEGATEADLADYAANLAEWYPEGGYYDRDTVIGVTDEYLLSNGTGADVTATVLYPFVGSLYTLSETLPTLTADGQPLETTLHAGGYSGGFTGAGGVENDLNLDQLNSWEEYKALLEDGRYQAAALSEPADLSDVPAVVYEFTDPWGPEEGDDAPNPTVQVWFDVDYDQVQVMSYGFHGGSYDRENGRMGLSFSIRQPNEATYGEPCYIILAGGDVSNMTTRVRVTGGWDEDTAVTEGGVTVRRIDTDLETALRNAALLDYGEKAGVWEYFEYDRSDVDFERYFALMKEYLLSYGVLAEDPVGRYDNGWLDMLDFGNVGRVFYLQAEVTVPAGGTLDLTAQLTKEPSYDYHCAHTENQGVNGFDLVTRLGSDLPLTGQTATLLDHGVIELVRQNFGFDLAAGVTTVTLDPAQEHYYLEVRPTDGE
ncbi:MAG: hypothetical protein IJ484_06565 [Oscillospiraceae bacterium]|nr:hypothetical protein [Oscillospiraceae bacterium]